MTHSDLTDTDLVDSEQFLFAEYAVGVEVERFLKSDVGRYVTGCAKQEIEKSFAGFMSDSCDVSQQANERYQAMIAKHALQWLLDAVANANAAEDELRKRDAEEGF